MTRQQELVCFYRLLRRYGLNDSHSGNASIRADARLWITPTGACADTLTVAALVGAPLDRAPPARASQDAALHARVYRDNREARAVLHCHGPCAVAMTLDGRDYEPQDLEGQLYFPRVPVVDIPYVQYFERSPGVVGPLLSRFPVVVVRGHGIFAWGRDPEEAYKRCCSLELSARTALLARAAGRPGPSP
jgi:L-fuculose-phosphate aldolase